MGDCCFLALGLNTRRAGSVSQVEKSSKRVTFVGVDVGSKKCSACLRDGGKELGDDLLGDVVDEFVFPNTVEGRKRFLERLWKRDSPVVVLESTGNYWRPLYRLLESRKVPVMVAHPARVKAIANARFKNDKNDARQLSHLGRIGSVPESYVPPVGVQQKRDLLRHREALVKQRTMLRNQVHALVAREGVDEEYSDLFGKQGRDFLEGLKLARIDAIILESSLRVLDTLDREIGLVEGELQAQATTDVDLLLSIPGFGYRIASLFLYEVGDIKRFPTHGHLASWIGIVPGDSSSGETERYGPIHKQGSRRLRYGLIQAAHAAVRGNDNIRAFHDRIAKRRGTRKAVVATAHKLVKIAYVVLRTREACKKTDPKKTERKVRELHVGAAQYPLALIKDADKPKQE